MLLLACNMSTIHDTLATSFVWFTLHFNYLYRGVKIMSLRLYLDCRAHRTHKGAGNSEAGWVVCHQIHSYEARHVRQWQAEDGWWEGSEQKLLLLILLLLLSPDLAREVPCSLDLATEEPPGLNSIQSIGEFDTPD